MTQAGNSRVKAGKESNRLDEAQTGLWTDLDDVLNRYTDPASCNDRCRMRYQRQIASSTKGR